MNHSGNKSQKYYRVLLSIGYSQWSFNLHNANKITRERHQRLQELAFGSRWPNTRRFNGVASVVKKWPNGRIPYVLSTEYNARERAVLAKAFQEYHGRTCIQFVPKMPFDRDYLYIGKIDGCYSDVGRAGGRQELSLDNGCLHVDTVIHELMHSVGFYHEHERWDRDNYLLILWQNIDKAAYDQFGRVDLVESSYYDQTYDYHSIMHYDSLAFSKNGRETLMAKMPEMTAVIGSATDFSRVDLAKIHKMYRCPNAGIDANLEFTGDNSIVGGSPVPVPAAFQMPPPQRLTPLPTVPLSLPPSNPGELRGEALFPVYLNPVRRFVEKPLSSFVRTEEGCADRTMLCGYWSQHCRSPHYAQFMRDHCAKTCNTCEGVADKPPTRPLPNSEFASHSFPVLVSAVRKR